MFEHAASKFGRHLAKALAALSLAITLASCQTGNNEKDLGSLLGHFSNKGLKIQTVTPLVADIAHADIALAAKISGREVGLYKFDVNKPKQKERLESVKAKKEMYLLGKKFVPAVNGSFVMIDYESNPEKDKILDAFNSF